VQRILVPASVSLTVSDFPHWQDSVCCMDVVDSHVVLAHRQGNSQALERLAKQGLNPDFPLFPDSPVCCTRHHSR
jgi:hypothetical protein